MNDLILPRLKMAATQNKAGQKMHRIQQVCDGFNRYFLNLTFIFFDIFENRLLRVNF